MIHDEATSSNEAHAKFKKVQQGVENEGYYFSKKERKKSRLNSSKFVLQLQIGVVLCFISNSICLFKVSNKRFFEYVTVVTRTMTQLNSQNTPLKIELTYHQSQLNICCWNKVPLGHKKEVGYMEPLRGSKRQTW